MSDNVREATFEEYVTNIILHILALETPFGIKRDLISQILGLSYRHERELIDAMRASE